MIRNAFFALLLASSPAVALDFSIPGGVVTKAENSPAETVRLPTRPWSTNVVPDSVEGAIRKRVLRIGGGAQTTLQLLAPMRDALNEAGFTEIFSCESQSCGGFDFRFQLDLLGEPEMHVDLGDYRYLLVENTDDDAETASQISLVVSRDAQAGYVHITEVFATDLMPAEIPPSATPAPLEHQGELIETLERSGHAVLSDLEFDSGASELSDATYQSLPVLAAWLEENPSAQIAIVGHTDAVGGLEGNTTLSKRRAQSVLSILANTYGASPTQMQADGVGYLAPITSNLTEEGRALNRRVEVILLSN
ncbi:MAG: OmpA family protein [Boseongicola sp.]|nr:OmpA family protein [Boseongicola sp.]